jgi:hypothetical protein
LKSKEIRKSFLKGLISILFLIVFGFYSFGNILLFNFIRQEIRSEIKTLIKSGDKSRVEIIAISKKNLKNPSIFKMVKSNEFIYQNKLYDIVSSTNTKDSIIFHCINDTKEEKLIKNFLTESINDLLNGSFNERLPKFNSLKLIFLDKINQITLNFINSYKTIKFIDFIENLKFIYSKIPTPPPRNC